MLTEPTVCPAGATHMVGPGGPSGIHSLAGSFLGFEQPQTLWNLYYRLHAVHSLEPGMHEFTCYWLYNLICFEPGIKIVEMVL